MKNPVKKIKNSAEDGARQAMVENLFYDFYKKKWHVFGMNFIRGIFFGIGSVLGATVVLAGFVWLLSWLVDIPGGVGEFIQYVVDLVQNR